MFTSLGPLELLIILLIVIALFGAGRIAGVGQALGKSVREFRSEARAGLEGEEEGEGEEGEDGAAEAPEAPGHHGRQRRRPGRERTQGSRREKARGLSRPLPTVPQAEIPCGGGA